VGALNAFYAAWHQLADFRFVYIREAHPVEGRVSPENVSQGIEVSQPRTLDERAAVAKSCALDLHIDLPVVLDDMADSTNLAYGGWPDRIYVVGKDGKIAWRSDPGPRHFDVAAAEVALRGAL